MTDSKRSQRFFMDLFAVQAGLNSVIQRILAVVGKIYFDDSPGGSFTAVFEPWRVTQR